MKKIFLCIICFCVVLTMFGCVAEKPVQNKDSIIEETVKDIIKETVDNKESQIVDSEKESIVPTEIESLENIEVTENTVMDSEFLEDEKEIEETLPESTVFYEPVDEIVYATSDVNIRKGPSTNDNIIGSLAYGKNIKRVGKGDNNWSKVIYNDEEAYISSNYLTTKKPEESINDASYPLTYSDSTCKITIEKRWFENAWCYIAHLEFSDYSRFGSVIAKDNRGSFETTSNAARRVNAIFCVNGPYNWGELANAYAIIRSGQVYNDINIHEDLGIYNSATGKLENAGELGISGKLASVAVSEGLATDTFKFWNSTLVKNGSNVSNPDNYDRAQRTFIATNGNAGDIYVIVAEGRKVDGKSAGLTKYECAKLVLDLGCSYGVMLDGGGSSTMYFNGKVLNSAKGNERAVVDFVYFR